MPYLWPPLPIAEKNLLLPIGSESSVPAWYRPDARYDRYSNANEAGISADKLSHAWKSTVPRK